MTASVFSPSEALAELEYALNHPAPAGEGRGGTVAVDRESLETLLEDWKRLRALAGETQAQEAAPAAETAVAHLAAHTDPRAPGFATWGMIVESPDGGVFAQRSGYLVNQSDVHALYQALQAALEASRGAFPRLRVLAPSQTVCGQMEGACQVGCGVEAAFGKARQARRGFARVRCRYVASPHLGAKYLAQSLLDDLVPPPPAPPAKAPKRSWLGLVGRRGPARGLSAPGGQG